MWQWRQHLQWNDKYLWSQKAVFMLCKLQSSGSLWELQMTDVKQWRAALLPKKDSSVDLPKRLLKKPTSKHQDGTVWQPESVFGHAKRRKCVILWRLWFQVMTGFWVLVLWHHDSACDILDLIINFLSRLGRNILNTVWSALAFKLLYRQLFSTERG